MTIPEWLFREPIENKIRKLYNPKPFRHLARDNNELDDKQLNKELAKKMINPHCFTDRNLKIGFKTTLENHLINHANSKLTITPKVNVIVLNSEMKFAILIKLEKIYLLFMRD